MQAKILKQVILNQLEKFRKAGFPKILIVLRMEKKRIIVSIFVLAVFLTYFLNLNSRRRMIADASYWEKQSSLAKSLLSELKSEQAVIDLLKNQAQVSHRLILLAQNQDMLQIVKDYAVRMNMRIINIKPDLDQQGDNNALIFNSQVIKTLTVEIEAESGYANLVRYFDTLYRVAPEFFSVEKLKITKPKMDSDRLKVLMELRFYSL